MRQSVARIFDEYLIAAARAGDRSALDKLAHNWQRKLLTHAYRLTGNYSQAQDVAQEAWIDIMKGLYGLKDTRVFPAWAYRIVTRRAADAIRRAQRKRRTEAAYAAEPAAANLSVQKLETSADAGPLYKAIAALPTNQRAAIALFYLEDFTVTEISVALEVPAGTVKTRLMHARKKLRAYLEGDRK